MSNAAPLTEAQFQKQITDLAELFGWDWVHCRNARTLDSWRTPTSGTMARGWVDLVLVRGNRLLFVEVKTDAGKLTPHQERVLDVLRLAAEVHVWRPRDWSFIEAVIGRKAALG